MDITQRVHNFIVENYLFGRDDHLQDDDSFLEKGIIDSTGILELISFVEQTFAISVASEELIPENLDSVDRISAYLQSKLKTLPTEIAAAPEISIGENL